MHVKRNTYCTVGLKSQMPQSILFDAARLETHPEITQGSACWSEILNNRPPRSSTSSKCPSRAIRYP